MAWRQELEAADLDDIQSPQLVMGATEYASSAAPGSEASPTPREVDTSNTPFCRLEIKAKRQLQSGGAGIKHSSDSGILWGILLPLKIHF